MMHRTVLISAATIWAGLCQGQRAEVMIWADEFSGSAVDPANWEFQIGDGTSYGLPSGWGNNELQFYRDVPANASVSGGVLRIVARQESFGGKSYTSARLRTRGRFEFAYGRVEARMKLPSTAGIWPAFWMLPTSSPYGGWAASGEIDIMESVNVADRIYGTIHYGAPWPGNVSAGGQYAPGTDFSQGFHTYSLEWEPNRMRWYVDGVLYRDISSAVWFSSAAQNNPRAPFDQPFHLLLNTAVGGNFPGNPNGGSQFPQTFEIDWVRVYQLQPGPFGGTPAAIPGVVEAENFDEGYPGQTYFDTDPGNNGNAYRPGDDVDIEPATGGGFNVGWIRQAEYMDYTVDIQQAGPYTLRARVASPSTGGLFSLQIDDIPIQGAEILAVPVTGGWQTWVELERTITLPAGVQRLRFQNLSTASQQFNFDRLTFVSDAPPCPADVNGDGLLTPADFSAWIAAFNAGSPAADQNGDGLVTPADFSAWVASYNAGCG
jgi:beta-glucanase (GH16 family)